MRISPAAPSSNPSLRSGNSDVTLRARRASGLACRVMKRSRNGLTIVAGVHPHVIGRQT